jgi:hypothetical protein
VDNMMLMVGGASAPPAPVKGQAKPGDVFPNEPTITASDTANAAKLAGLGYVAVPTTAWTAGQHITVNGFDFTWGGTFWVAGSPAAVSVTGIDPSQATAGCEDVTVTITGTGFTEGLAATFGGQGVETTYVSDTELTIVIPAELLQTPGGKQVRVGSSYKLFSVIEGTP